MDIDGKTIVLTGATGGIGKAIARELSARGGRLVLVARNAARLADLTQELGSRNHRAISADLGSRAGRNCVLDTCRLTGASLLINNAGSSDFGLFESQSGDAIRALIDINLVSPMLLTRDLLPMLSEQAEAGIINIGSIFGSIGYPGFSAYSASKFGLRGFTEALRRELDGSTVRVSYVAPRATRTALNSDAVVAMNDALGTAMDDPSMVADEVMRVIRSPARSDSYIGWPEKLFVRVNALLPGLVDSGLRKQLPVIRRFAARKA